MELSPRAVLATLAILVGGTMLFGDADLNAGYVAFNYGKTERAARILAVWSQPAIEAGVVATNQSIDAIQPRSLLADARSWYAVAVRREPQNTQIWSELGSADIASGHYASARAAYDHSLALDRFNVDALLGLGHLDQRLGNQDRATALFRRASAIAPHFSEVVQALDSVPARR